ncbi:hypothetical protein GCM10009730_59040 [Streptomyces albidochromogenes]|uniref:hypothetical protein n=1 Tax=Streptomyces albidochromogenes TaxID=329524 RepID=UPI002FE80ED0
MAVEDLSGFYDHYREALEGLIRAKAEGTKPEGAPAEPTAAPVVVDLMSALLESVESARQARVKTRSFCYWARTADAAPRVRRLTARGA